MRKTQTKKQNGFLDPKQSNPSHGQLREAAYYRWLERGMPEGEGLEDWFEVENKWRDNIVPSRND